MHFRIFYHYCYNFLGTLSIEGVNRKMLKSFRYIGYLTSFFGRRVHGVNTGKYVEPFIHSGVFNQLFIIASFGTLRFFGKGPVFPPPLEMFRILHVY